MSKSRKPLEERIAKARAAAAERRANIANGSADYPKLSAWFALYAESEFEGSHALTVARMWGIADFDPDQEQGESPTQDQSQAATPSTKGATDAEVAALAARIVAHVQ